MAANNFKVFNESKTNIMSDTDYGTHIQRENGVSSGLAVSALHNKLYRQTSIAAKAVADFIASQELDATDNDSVLFSTNLLKALEKVTKVPLDGHRTKEVLDHPDSSVTTPKIANRNVTTEKIAYNSVGTPELKAEVFNSHNADVNAHKPITDTVPRISILTGTCSDGETIPLPDGYTESQCKIFVSMATQNPNGYWYDPAESGSRNMLKVECYTEGRILRCAMIADGFDNWRTGRDSGSTVNKSRMGCLANYMVVGIKYGG